MREEQRIIDWAQDRRRIVIAGHTHRPMFLTRSHQEHELKHTGRPWYFNCGSGVHPRCITGIEVERGRLTLVKWHVATERGGYLRVMRTALPGCSVLLEDLLWLVNRRTNE